MYPFAALTGSQVGILLVILLFFLISIVISLSVKKRDQGDQDLEHFDHEPGEYDTH